MMASAWYTSLGIVRRKYGNRSFELRAALVEKKLIWRLHGGVGEGDGGTEVHLMLDRS